MTKISVFNHAKDNVPKDYDLDTWLEQTIVPSEELETIVEQYRQTKDDKLKRDLPCCSISAWFQERRHLDNIGGKNEFICIDVDRYAKSKKKKCNICIDMELVKKFFSEHPSTYYCGYSCGGDGVYAIIKIAEPDKLADYFQMFQRNLARVGINIDDVCKDYTRLRFFSVDRAAFYNPQAVAYKLPKPVQAVKPQHGFHILKSDAEKVEKIVQIIEQTGMDITQNYEDWVKVAGALNDGFGESGLEYFHRISSNHPEYNSKETSKKYYNCRNMSRIKLAAFFYVATSYGIRY